MTKMKSPTTNEELVQALADLFDEVEPQNPEGVDEALREAGHDPAVVEARMRAFAAKALEESPLNWRVRAEGEIEAARAQLQAESKPVFGNREDVVAALRKLLNSLGGKQPAAAFFRSFEEMTDADLESLFQQLQHLSSDSAGKSNNSGE